jgi:hypothetical protein
VEIGMSVAAFRRRESGGFDDMEAPAAGEDEEPADLQRTELRKVLPVYTPSVLYLSRRSRPEFPWDPDRAR